MKSNKSISDNLIRFLLKRIKFIIIFLLLPQVALLIFENINNNEKCIATTKIRISKSVSNLSIVDEIFIENLDIENMNRVILSGPHITIEGNKKEECEEKYKILLKNTAQANGLIEQFYLATLNDMERSRFSGPILFNSIGGKKIQFATLTPLDRESLKNKDQTFRKIFTFIISIILIVLWSLLNTLNIRKFYL